MGPDNSPVAGLAQAGQIAREETPIVKGMVALEKATMMLQDAVARHENRIRPALSPSGTVDGKPEKTPQPPYSDLAIALTERAQAIYAVARQLEELTNRVEL